MAKPEQNSYVITVILRDVKKTQALQMADAIRNAGFEIDDLPEPQVFTAHLKDEK